MLKCIYTHIVPKQSIRREVGVRYTVTCNFHSNQNTQDYTITHYMNTNKQTKTKSLKPKEPPH